MKKEKMFLNGEFNTSIWNSPYVESPSDPVAACGTRMSGDDALLTWGIVLLLVLELWWKVPARYDSRTGFQISLPFPLEARASTDQALILLSRGRRLVGHGRALLTFQGGLLVSRCTEVSLQFGFGQQEIVLIWPILMLGVFLVPTQG